jgi:hypothetical protein
MAAKFPDYFHKVVEIGSFQTITPHITTATKSVAATIVASIVVVVVGGGGERRQWVIVVVSEMPYRPKVAPARDV